MASRSRQPSYSRVQECKLTPSLSLAGDMNRKFSVFWQMFGAFGLLTIVALGALGLTIGAWVEKHSLGRVEEHLKMKAILIREIIRGNSLEEIQSKVLSLRQYTEARITLISEDGKVLAESDRESTADLENHIHRPEIESAKANEVGVAFRHSSTLNQDFMYVAVKKPLQGIEYFRVALPITEVQREVSQIRSLIASVGGLTAMIVLWLAWSLARRVAMPLSELNEGAERIAAGEMGHKVYLDRRDEVGQLAASFNRMSERLSEQFTQIEEDRSQLRAVLGSMMEGVIAISADQQILFANERAGQLLGFPVEQAGKRKVWEVVRQHAVLERLQNNIDEGKESAASIEFTGPNGRSLLMHTARLPGEPVRGTVLVFHDLTELRRLERMRQDFVANVSHELKTPLAVITACVETLRDGGMDDVEHRDKFLDSIHEQSQRLLALILDMLSLARIESKDHNLTLKPLDMAKIANACIELHQTRAAGKNQKLILEPPSGRPVYVLADEEALSEILENLIDNAVKYTPENGEIRVSWARENGRCLIKVRDNGIGIAKQELPRIFERFYRVDKARSREMGGTGLGLSIVKHLADALGGQVSATSEIGQGSTFLVELPAVD